MGVVYAAYDPKLDRKVALKLVLGVSARHSSHQRLMREAQALARLSHPNVVSVHDVGSVDDQLFIAMEFVEGLALVDWSAQERTLQERLDVLRAAGNGLAAAHDAGLLHRDFKPDNVLVGTDGRVRVMDFGLARADTPELAEVHPADGKLSASPLSTSLTQPGAMMGTPAYMAPEQFVGAGSDARSDQFSFFVVVYEVLFGAHPYDTSTLAVLTSRATDGVSVRVPAEGGVPASIRRAIERGLAAQRDARFPGMHEAIEGLTLTRHRGRLKEVAAVGILAIFSVFASLSMGNEDPCAAATEAIDRSWNDTARASIRRAFEATGAPFAIATADRTIESLDRVSREHADLRREVCEATHIAGTQSEGLLDRRMECLEHHRFRLEGLVSVLSESSMDAASNALQAISTLPRASDCLLISSAEQLAPPPREDRKDEVTRLTEVIARAQAQIVAGDADEATALLAAEAEAVEGVDYLPLRAEFRHAQAMAHVHVGDGEEAKELLRALSLSVELGDDMLSLRNLESYVYTAIASAKLDQAEVWLVLAESLAARRGDRLSEQILLETARARYVGARGDRVGRVSHLHRALTLQLEFDADDRLAIAQIHCNLGRAYLSAGEPQSGEEHYQQCVDLHVALFGAGHPRTAAGYLGLAAAARARGEIDAALSWNERALVSLQKSYGERSILLANDYSSFADSLAAAGEYDRSEEYYRRSLSLTEGNADYQLAYMKTSSNYGVMLWFAGRFAEALNIQEEILGMYTELADVSQLDVGHAEGNLAATLSSLGRHEQSLAYHASALARFMEVLPANDASFGVAYLDYSMPLIALDRWDEALVLLERAESVYLEHKDLDPLNLVEVRVAMVEALRPQTVHRNRKRAKKLGSEIRAAIPGLGARGEALLQRLEAAEFRDPSRG